MIASAVKGRPPSGSGLVHAAYVDLMMDFSWARWTGISAGFAGMIPLFFTMSAQTSRRSMIKKHDVSCRNKQTVNGKERSTGLSKEVPVFYFE
jgi:hypothetical protein